MSTKVEFLVGEGDRRETVTFDSADIDYGYEGAITSHPIEDGATISDHFRPDPRTFSISGFISDHPFVDSGNGTARDALERLVANWETGTPVEVFTPLQDLGDCLVKSISVTQNSSNGGGVALTVEIQQVFTVEVRQGQRVPVRRKTKLRDAGETSKTQKNESGVKSKVGPLEAISQRFFGSS